MPRNKIRKKPGPDEIPQLKAMGLTAVKTAGHGKLYLNLLDGPFADRHVTDYTPR